MKKLLLLILLVPFVCSAQIDILPQTGVPRVLIGTFREIGASYYFLSYRTSNAAKDIFNNHPVQYLLNKVDKNTNALTSVAVAMGDTLQVDSLIAPFWQYGQMQQSPDGRIYIVYQKQIKQDFSLPTYQQWKTAMYCTIFDTSMQAVVSDKRLVITDGYEQMYAPYPQALGFSGNRLLIGYGLQDTAGTHTMAKYMLLDGHAAVLKQDTLGDKVAAVQPGEHYVVKFCASKNRVAFWGFQLLPDPFAGGAPYYSITVLDTALTLIDTFIAGDFNGMDSFYYAERRTNSVLLPSGTLIQGHCASGNSVKNKMIQSAITRHSLNHPFQIDKYALFSGKDIADEYHCALGPGYEAVVYNVSDGSIYYANNTHSDFDWNYCSPNNYVEVICVDTNLHRKWIKYIQSDTNAWCAFADHLVPGDGRPGVIVCGSNAGVAPFAYYLDSTGTLSVPNTAHAFIRDRFRVYPNPAVSKLYADDVFDQLKDAVIYGMDGRAVMHQSLTAGKNELNVALLPPGLYLIRLMSRDNEVYQMKFVKE